MKKSITRITALLAAALLAGCGSISSKDGGYYTTEAAAQRAPTIAPQAGTDSSLMPPQRRRGCHRRDRAENHL